MGNTSYNFESRSTRTAFYNSATTDQLFTQQNEKKAHDSMLPKGITVREARDSATHPYTVPVILGLDETGSMGDIPLNMIKEGLPKLMSNLIERGVPDAALLFLGIGDHESDRFPLQVGQFESGDEELDLWLTHTYLEGKGGGNGGESYLLAWYFAAFHTATDAWDKRKEKGLLFTVGDEPNLQYLPASVINDLMGTTHEKGFTAVELLAKAQERYNVFHIIVNHSETAQRSIKGWEAELGQNCIVLDSHKEVADTIAKTVLAHSTKHFSVKAGPDTDITSTNESEIYL